MITDSLRIDISSLDAETDYFIYGLGYESRCLEVARRITAKVKFALQMPETDAHRYKQNFAEAEYAGHTIVHLFPDFMTTIDEIFESADRDSLTITIDISAINRTMMFALLSRIGLRCRDSDKIRIYYVPAAFDEPDWRFPQIERLGPVSSEYSGFDADPSRPLCLILGLGFEPGVSMGIISQLEPTISFCFWGAGTDGRFESAVKKANFDFKFTGFNTRTSPYLIFDPIGAFVALESLVYGLVQDFNVVMVPMGPKIFSLLSFLVSNRHPGKISVWRAQQKRSAPFDAKADSHAAYIELDVPAFSASSRRRFDLVSDTQLTS